jgi:hypothetical protein
MKRALVVVLLLGVSSTARADERTPWKVALGTGLAVTVGGVAMTWYGVDMRNDARDQLCAGGASFNNYDCPGPMAPVTLTQERINELNDQGDRGARNAYIGMGIALAGGVVTGVALYKVLTVTPKKREPRTVFAPTVSKHAAGAALTFSW